MPNILKLLVISFLLAGCSHQLYTLPDPPPKSEWINNATAPDSKEREQNMRYLEARTNALKLFSALSTQNFDEATVLLAPQTIAWLTNNGKQSLNDVLRPLNEKEKITHSRPDPITTLLASDLSKLSDRIEGIKEDENSNRIEIFSPLGDGTYQRIVMIKVGDNWKLLRTELPTPVKPEL